MAESCRLSLRRDCCFGSLLVYMIGLIISRSFTQISYDVDSAVSARAGPCRAIGIAQTIPGENLVVYHGTNSKF